MAKLQASTLEEFFTELELVRDKLPVITQEIGDTWIQGIASDPRKMAEFRAVERVLGTCLQNGQIRKIRAKSRVILYLYMYLYFWLYKVKNRRMLLNV